MWSAGAARRGRGQPPPAAPARLIDSRAPAARPAPPTNPRRSRTVADRAAPRPRACAGLLGTASVSSQRSATAPTTTPAMAIAAAAAGEPDGRTASALTASNPATAITVGPGHHLRRASKPSTAPATSAVTTMPATSAGLSVVPSDPMAARTTAPGASATTRSAMASTREGAGEQMGGFHGRDRDPRGHCSGDGRSRSGDRRGCRRFHGCIGARREPSVSADARRAARVRTGRPTRRL